MRHKEKLGQPQEKNVRQKTRQRKAETVKKKNKECKIKGERKRNPISKKYTKCKMKGDTNKTGTQKITNVR